MTTELVDPPAAGQPDDLAAAAVDGQRGGRVVAPKKRRRRALRKVERATIVTHRWLSLVLGLLLVVITTTGAAVVYSPEWTRWTNSAAFHVTPTKHPISPITALDLVAKAHPKFEAASINIYSGIDEIESRDDDKHPGFYAVDPGSGHINGYVDPNRGVMAFMEQVHECFFTCDSYPVYLAFLNHDMPTLGFMGWLKGVTIGDFILGVLGLMLIFLAVSGAWLWWPSLKRLAGGFKVRLKRGRYARDYDLHQVIGIVAVPFLLMWGITGASFEFHWVSTAWYAVTGGHQVPDDSFASLKVKAKTPEITTAQALAAAQKVAGLNRPMKNLFAPDPGDKTGVYYVYFASGLDPARYGSAPGEYLVEVDQHSADRTKVVDYGSAPTVSNKILDVWGSEAGHYGATFNPWVRFIWFLFGLTPLALAITGLSTWLVKRKVKKRRRTAAVIPEAAAAPA